MFRQLLARFALVPVAVFAAFALSFPRDAGGQEESKSPASSPRSIEKPVPEKKDLDTPQPTAAETRLAEIDRIFAVYDLRPRPMPPIPDNPPPHEGAMLTTFPHIIEPPDLMLVEVLEALPGRPISGERLVRPDGTISLGFYGDVKVAGLTLVQAKVAIIKHLRRFLTDEVLGLEFQTFEEGTAVDPGPFRENPREPEAVPVEKQKSKPRSSSLRSRPGPSSRKTRSISSESGRTLRSLRPVRWQAPAAPPPHQQDSAPAPNQVRVPVNGSGRITITIDVGGQVVPSNDKSEPPPPPSNENAANWEVVPPQDSGAVFVDITSYNSKYYYIQGDFQIPGRNTITGNETVLDAVQFAGGFLASAEPKDLHLIRPGRGGKPARIYPINIEAIQSRGDVATNYQLFPGDRLVVGRNEVIKKTVEIDRLNAPLQSLSGFILQEAFLLRALQFATSEDRNQLLKEYVDFWAQELSRPGGIKLDEQTIRDAFTRRMKLPPNPSAPAPSTTIPSPR